MPGPYLRQQLAQVFNKSIVDLGLFIDQEEVIKTEEIEEEKCSCPFHASRLESGTTHEHIVGRKHELDTLTHWD